MYSILCVSILKNDIPGVPKESALTINDHNSRIINQKINSNISISKSASPLSIKIIIRRPFVQLHEAAKHFFLGQPVYNLKSPYSSFLSY